MLLLRRALPSAVALLLLAGVADTLAQRPLCSQLPEGERGRARAAGLCRDPAPIIDVAPKTAPQEVTPPAIPVPGVIGMNFDDARNRLNRFTVQRTYRAASEAGGTVLAQTPMAPATLPPGSEVSLVLSDGSLVRVPRVTGININDARQRLQQQTDLRPQPVVVTSELRVGTVIEQQPAEGTLVKRGSVIRLQVSAGQEGPEMIEVPNVVGMPLDRAKARLARFTVERVDRPKGEKGNQAPEGQVIDQTPRAATRLAVGSIIQLAVSGAPRVPIELFEMPNVVGRSFADASRVLGEFKVTRTEVDSSSARDRIVAQTPVAGATLMPGDAVALQVSMGPAQTKAAAKDAPIAAANSSAADAGSWRAVLAIGGGVLLGIIAGALLMWHWLARRRSVAVGDDTIASLSPAAAATLPDAAATLPEAASLRNLSTVDILLEPERAIDEQPHAQGGGRTSEPVDSADEEDSQRQKTDQGAS